MKALVRPQEDFRTSLIIVGLEMDKDMMSRLSDLLAAAGTLNETHASNQVIEIAHFGEAAVIIAPSTWFTPLNISVEDPTSSVQKILELVSP